jgi:DNA-binding MarR family transcriptional regulator
VDTTPGARLAMLQLRGFRSMTAEVVAELERRGHPGVTATHEFALRAIDEGATDASALGRALGVSKQAAAKTIAALEQLGYVDRLVDPADARRRPLRVTARGHEMEAIGGAAFTALRNALEREIGEGALLALEEALERIAALSLPAGSDHRAAAGRTT